MHFLVPQFTPITDLRPRPLPPRGHKHKRRSKTRGRMTTRSMRKGPTSLSKSRFFAYWLAHFSPLSLSTSLHMIELCFSFTISTKQPKLASAKCHQARAGYDQLDPTPTLSPRRPLPRLKTIPKCRPTPVEAPLPELELETNVAALPPSLSRPTP